MEIKEDRQGSICKDCKSKDIVWSMSFKKEVCRDCGSGRIAPIVKKWVAVDDYSSFLNRIKAPFPDFPCECSDEHGTCAMCAVKKMVEEELNSLSNEKTIDRTR